MLHLSSERLAALVDEPAAAAEVEHLRDCAQCSREVGAYRALVAAARDERERIGPPITTWDSLSAHLRSNEVLRSASDSASAWWRQAWLQAAAAIVFVTVGLVIGRYTAGDPIAGRSSAAVASVDATRGGAEAATQFASRDEALETLARAGTLYQHAAAYLVREDSASRVESTDLYRTRLAALDEVAAATQRALHEVPYDPVINRYYLATMGARQATLEQLGTAMPVGVRLTGF